MQRLDGERLGVEVMEHIIAILVKNCKPRGSENPQLALGGSIRTRDALQDGRPFLRRRRPMPVLQGRHREKMVADGLRQSRGHFSNHARKLSGWTVEASLE